VPIPNILQTGHSGLMAAKGGIATAGHNIANANTEGFSRQRVTTEATEPRGSLYGNRVFGTGTKLSRVDRFNDEYLEKQIRNSNRDLSYHEEKEVSLKQVEDIFNEMNGDGLNRLLSKFFNEFRKLSNEPESPAIRQSVKESSQAMVNDFHRLRSELDSVRRHMDSRIEGCVSEINSLVKEIADQNDSIKLVEITGGSPNDLLDKRDLALKKLGSYFDISARLDNKHNLTVDLRGIGPLVSAKESQTLSVERTQADDRGKVAQAADIRFSGSSSQVITHQIKTGKLGALLEVRDQYLSNMAERLDELAYSLVKSVNDIHATGVTPSGATGVMFFKPLDQKDRASEFISLSHEISAGAHNIATAMTSDAPGDNRIPLAISKLQTDRVVDQNTATLEDFYNSIVSGVGVNLSRNRFDMNQQKDIMSQLSKLREQISGVSIDEETTLLLQFQHAFDASAKVIQVADEMLKEILSLGRW